MTSGRVVTLSSSYLDHRVSCDFLVNLDASKGSTFLYTETRARGCAEASAGITADALGGNGRDAQCYKPREKEPASVASPHSGEL